MSIQLKGLFLELDFFRECNHALFLISSLQRGRVAQRERERERWPFSETLKKWVRTLPHLNSCTALQNNVSIIQQQPLIWPGVFFQSTFPLLAETCLHSDKAASPAAKHVYVFISDTKKTLQIFNFLCPKWHFPGLFVRMKMSLLERDNRSFLLL